MEPKVYVAVMDDKTVKLFTGEIVENNLVEVGQKVSSYKMSDALPNWLDMALRRRERQHPDRQKGK